MSTRPLDESEEVTEQPEITTHVEPPRQGGTAFIRCEGCGREVIGTDPDRLPHRDDCRLGGDRR